RKCHNCARAAKGPCSHFEPGTGHLVYNQFCRSEGMVKKMNPYKSAVSITGAAASAPKVVITNKAKKGLCAVMTRKRAKSATVIEDTKDESEALTPKPKKAKLDTIVPSPAPFIANEVVK